MHSLSRLMGVDSFKALITMKLLEVQSSVRQDGSVSRALSDEFIQAWQGNQAVKSQIQHRQRDVGFEPPAHPTALWTQANYTAPEARSPDMTNALSRSEELIEELLWADYLVLGVPMYNFSVPCTLKAYLDNIIRINRTFSFDPTTHAFRGLVEGKKALIITPSAGDFTSSTPLAHMNFCDTYLKSVLGFIGIHNVTVVAAPNQFMADDAREQSTQAARKALMQLAEQW